MKVKKIISGVAAFLLATSSAFNGMTTNTNFWSERNYVSASSLGTLTITTNLTDVTVKDGETAEYKIEAVGENLTYKWEYSRDGGKTWKKCSCTAATYRFKALSSYSGNLYRCTVSDGTDSKTSSAVTLTVTPSLTITTQPVSATYFEKDHAVFSVSVSDSTGVTYQWMYSDDNGATWKNCTSTGYNTSSLTIDSASYSMNGYLFKCVVNKGSETLTTQTAILTVEYILDEDETKIIELPWIEF